MELELPKGGCVRIALRMHPSSNIKKSPDHNWHFNKCDPPTNHHSLYHTLATMPRSATDATRFTSTTPHASKPISKPTSAAHLPSRNTPPRKPAGKTGAAAPAAAGGETPLEKVKRLRAAADRARDAQVSTFDKVLVRGRVWADRAHRFTALTLIGATCKIPSLL